MTDSATTRYKNPKLEVKVYDYIQSILLKRYRLIAALLSTIIILGIVVIPFVAKLNPARQYTKTVRMVFSILALVSSIFSLIAICLGIYFTNNDRKEMTPISKDSDREIQSFHHLYEDSTSKGKIKRILEGNQLMRLLYLFCAIQVLSYLVCLGHTAEDMVVKYSTTFLLIAFIILLLLNIIVLLIVIFYSKITESLKDMEFDIYSMNCLMELHHLPF